MRNGDHDKLLPREINKKKMSSANEATVNNGGKEDAREEKKYLPEKKQRCEV